MVRFSRFLKPPISNIIDTKDCDSYYMKCTRNRINVRSCVYAYARPVYSLVTIFNNKTIVIAENETYAHVLSPSNSEPSDSESELESQPGPSKKSAKKRKIKYKSKFSKEWTKTWPFHRCATWRYPFLFMYCML